jgi:tyrosyl-DNA phosphodiesterase 1
MATSPRPAKKQRIEDGRAADPAVVREQRAAFLASMSRDISPPPPASRTSRGTSIDGGIGKVRVDRSDAYSDTKQSHPRGQVEDRSLDLDVPSQPDRIPRLKRAESIGSLPEAFPSPFKLTSIRDLPPDRNVDTISLHDILGNPLIKEIWVFNFCFDIDWMMQHFDEDIRSLVKVKVIHGSWKREDGNKLGIDDACRRWPNVEAATAYLPDPFGTHHSKMFVIFTHDDTAEVIIHTANMLAKDWTNMAQAVWRTGPLPTCKGNDGELAELGAGQRFKFDLLAYLKAYKKPTAALVEMLRTFDFSNVRGALVASVPSHVDNKAACSAEAEHLWGYPQLREVISHVKRKGATRPSLAAQHGHLIMQVSSIATLHNGWLDNLIQCFGSPASTAIIYPTAPNVAQSLDGYAAGGSIHTKAQSAAHLKQINALRPHLHQWTRGPSKDHDSQRALAAPHIKTYIEFAETPTRKCLVAGKAQINWALVTSANLSTQAWGGLPKPSNKNKTKNKSKNQGSSSDGKVQIQSFEIGVMVWPELWAVQDSEGSNADADAGKDNMSPRMVPVFGRDQPASLSGQACVVGIRMPYDLPLTPYAAGELPWSPQGSYEVPDRLGRVWAGY